MPGAKTVLWESELSLRADELRKDPSLNPQHPPGTGWLGSGHLRAERQKIKPKRAALMRFALLSRDTGRFKQLSEVFEQNYSTIVSASDPETMVKMLESYTLHGVVIDCLDEGYNPIDLIQLIRPYTAGALVALIRSEEELIRVLALESGADDCLDYRFTPRELLARLRAIVRRAGSKAPKPNGVLRVGEVVMRKNEFRVLVSDRECNLTNAEFSILERLMEAGGNVVTREELTLDALGRKLQAADRSIDVHISRLRQKLGPSADGSQRILSVRGRGYRLRSQ